MLSVSEQVVHCKIESYNDKTKFRASFVYGLHVVGDRRRLWQELDDICRGVNCPWVALGDCNAVYEVGHRVGGKPVAMLEMEDGCNFIVEINCPLLNP